MRCLIPHLLYQDKNVYVSEYNQSNVHVTYYWRLKLHWYCLPSTEHALNCSDSHVSFRHFQFLRRGRGGFFYMWYKSAAMSIKFLLFIYRYSHDISMCEVGCQGSSDTPSPGNSNLLHLHNKVTENKHLISLVNQNTVILGPLWFFFI